ncbi:uncharacterized protein ARMOST_16722 [Armillaria ostoyae]|uniref:Uncharacterized protein n=1 Tax=Armillaria ostoyae TaxID=47428 RepID=A0A284RX06_ARMOS|nr:uncharacterized protein ARMOST_16722 [Armillaria ostoyae]
MPHTPWSEDEEHTGDMVPLALEQPYQLLLRIPHHNASCVEWEAMPRGWEPIGPPCTPLPPGWGNGDQWWGDLAEGEWGFEGQWGSGPWGQDSKAEVQDSDRGTAWGQDPDAGVGYVADLVMCSVTASGKRLVGGNELQPTLNLSTLYTITNVLNLGVSSTIEALCRLNNQDLHSCIPNRNIEFVMLKLVKPQGPAYTSDQHTHLRKNAVYYYKVKQAGPAALAGFLTKFYAEWFLLFRLDNSLSDLDREAARAAHEKDLVKMLKWEYWMWPSVTKAIESSCTHAFAENDEAQMICLQARWDEMDKQAAHICETIDAQFQLCNPGKDLARTVHQSGGPP